MYHLQKPDIAIKTTEEAKVFPFWKEIGFFIQVFFFSSFLAGLIPAIYQVKLMSDDPTMYDDVADIMEGDHVLSGMMGWVTANMDDVMYLMTLFCTIIIIAGVLLFCIRKEKRSFYTMGMERRGMVAKYIKGATLGLVIFSICIWVGVAIGVITFASVTPASAVVIILYALGFMVQGFSEEIAFRGYFMISLMKRGSALRAVLISSFAFAFCHILNPGITVLAFANIMLFGIFLSIYIIRTNSIWGAAAFHSMWNFAQGVIYGVSVSGTTVKSSIVATILDSENVMLSGGEFGIEGSVITTFVLVILIACSLVRHRKKGGQM